MTRFLSVERISADTHLARQTPPGPGLAAGARETAEGLTRPSADPFLRIAVELVALGLFLGAVVIWAGAITGGLC